MAKGMGLLLLFSCGTMLGWSKARSLEQRAGELAAWQEFLRQFRTVLASTRAAPGEIVKMLAKQTAFTDLRGVQKMAEAFRESGSFAHAAQAAAGNGKRGAAEGLLLSLGDTVGIQPLEEQLSALESAILLLDREAEAAREESRRYGGLFRRLGVLLGLLAVVVLA